MSEKETQKEILLQTLREIETKTGMVTPRALVDKARASDSPLHGLFEWDNARGAENYRLWQARQHISHVRVEFMGQETSGYWNATVEIEDVPVRGYFSTAQVASDEAIRSVVVKEAVQNLVHWQKKYKELRELSGVVNEKKLHRLRKSIS